MTYHIYYTFKIDEPQKAYVGMTIKPIETGYKGSGTYLKNALAKYGKGSFTRTDLGGFNNKEECHFWEGFYIKTLKTLKSQGGYNISPKGGMNGYNSQSEESKELNRIAHLGKKMSEDTRKKMSQNSGVNKPGVNESRSAKLKGRPSPMKGRYHTEKSKEKNRKALIGRVSPMKGKYHTDEAKKKIAVASKGRIPWNKGRKKITV